ncbi:hypothetical protein [Haliangium sp.]|uniref:hypothetical protein n=1 Tax=Haliangium sp. TaxID=2663208 RepID=UPI003D0F9E1B
MKRPSDSSAGGIVPAVASAIVPGLGQLINKQSDKAIGVFAVAAGASLLSWVGVPFIGLVGIGTWIYGIYDGYVQGKKGG